MEKAGKLAMYQQAIARAYFQPDSGSRFTVFDAADRHEASRHGAACSVAAAASILGLGCKRMTMSEIGGTNRMVWERRWQRILAIESCEGGFLRHYLVQNEVPHINGRVMPSYNSGRRL